MKMAFLLGDKNVFNSMNILKITEHNKLVNCMVCELYLSKAVIKKILSPGWCGSVD